MRKRERHTWGTRTCACPTYAEHFWRAVDRSGGAESCWLWTRGRTPAGYGHVGLPLESTLGADERAKFGPAWPDTMPAQRVAWIVTNGPIEEGFFVCHRCDNPPCCNPAHLFLGTNADNMADAAQKGRMPHGEEHYFHQHPEAVPRGSRHYLAKLDEPKVRELRALSMAGATRAELARRYGVTPAAVRFVLVGKTWTHVK